ncbi:MAG: hypothetical protein EOO19_05840 [Chryseobacterium sp.]|nr:MAG: hypothetical protein EOO19_05840 [Chryseobacterium sp.]
MSTFGLGGYNVSLKELQSYNSLKRFWFGDKIKDFYSISSIHNLEEISIMSQNLKSLEFLFSLKKLKNLSFSFGGTTYFEELPTLVSIEQLDFWRIRKLEVQHLLPINNVENLKTLMLIELPRITNLGWIKNDKLETLVLQDMKGLQSYESLAEIGNVERLVIKDTLNKEKIDSLEKLANIKEIQVYGGYVDDHNHYIHKTKVAEKVKTMELKYQI